MNAPPGTQQIGVSKETGLPVFWPAAQVPIIAEIIGEPLPSSTKVWPAANLAEIPAAIAKHLAPSSGFLGKIAKTLGGAASGLAKGVSAATQVAGHAFTDVTSSDAWKTIAVGVGTVGNLALPGIASGISAGMLTATKIGQAASAKDIVINAAREQIPDGPEKTGFDIGTGIAIHGAGMTGADLQSVRAKLDPGGARAGFDSALAIHVGRITAKRPAPPNLPPAARAAFYASRGMVKVGAPRKVRAGVVKSIAHSPVAKLGVRAAIRQQESHEKEMSYLEWAFRKVRDAVSKSNPMSIHGEYFE